MIFHKKDKIANYTVEFPIKRGAYAETYRVKDPEGLLYFLKLIDFSRLSHEQIDDNGEIVEICISKTINNINNDNICQYVASGELTLDDRRYAYLVTEFVSGETIAERMVRERFSVYDTKQVAISVLQALDILHCANIPILHNEVTAQNVLLDLDSDYSNAKLIDFGNAQYKHNRIIRPDRNKLNLFYLSPERLSGIQTIEGDLFSVGVMIYQMLFDTLPWFVDLSAVDDGEQIDLICESRRGPLLIPNGDLYEIDEQLLNTIMKALQPNIELRFHCAKDFIAALKGEIKIEKQVFVNKESTTQKNILVGNGFSDVAGMSDLKAKLTSEVVEVIRNPEVAKELGVSIPNGILLYGPPGCGKTYIAEKFAEELKFNYKYIDCSDIATPWIHGGQSKIAKIFEECREKAPTILFLDEVDSILKDRNKHSNVSEAGEVNVFLTQLNNCGRKGVFVIAATNNPADIDKAALRSGRIEQKIYVPLPDFESRKQQFVIGLRSRRRELGIDYDLLARNTEKYSCADISLIIDTAARLALLDKTGKITQTQIENSIKKVCPMSKEDIDKYESYKKIFERNAVIHQKKIGFK